MKEMNWGWSCTGLENFPITKVCCCTLICGDEGPLKYLWANHFMMGNLLMGGNGVYITAVRRPGVVRNDFKNYGFDLAPYEKDNRFCFVDLYPYFDAISSERFHASIKEKTLNHFSLALTDALKFVKSKDGTVVLDSISALMLYFKPNDVARFVLEQAAKICSVEWSGLFIMEKGIAEEHIERMIRTVLDGVYEISGGEGEYCGEFKALWIKGVLDKPMVKKFKDNVLVDHHICLERMKKKAAH